MSAITLPAGDDQIFCMGTLNQQLVRILLDEGAQISMVNSSLVPPPAPDAPLVTVSCPWGSQRSLPRTELRLTVQDQDISFPALICPTLNVDLILGLNCKQFYEVRQKAIEGQFQTGAITRQQAQLDLQDSLQQRADQQTNGLPATPLTDILGPDFDFTQSNLSLDHSNHDLTPQSQKSLDADAIAKDQKDDPTLSDLFRQANFSNDTEIVLEKDILHRKTSDKDGVPYLQVVLPKNRRQEVLRTAHSTPMAGHTGSKPTKFKIMKNFFWPNMSADIKTYCRSCERCQKTAKKYFP